MTLFTDWNRTRFNLIIMATATSLPSQSQTRKNEPTSSIYRLVPAITAAITLKRTSGRTRSVSASCPLSGVRRRTIWSKLYRKTPLFTPKTLPLPMSSATSYTFWTTTRSSTKSTSSGDLWAPLHLSISLSRSATPVFVSCASFCTGKTPQWAALLLPCLFGGTAGKSNPAWTQISS